MYITTTLIGEVTFIYQSQNLALVGMLLDFLGQRFLTLYQQKIKDQSRFLPSSFLLNLTLFQHF